MLPENEVEQSDIDLQFTEFLKSSDAIGDINKQGFEKSVNILTTIRQTLANQATETLNSFQLLGRNFADSFTNIGGLFPDRAERIRAIAAQEETAAVSDATRKTPNLLVGIGETLQNIDRRTLSSIYDVMADVDKNILGLIAVRESSGDPFAEAEAEESRRESLRSADDDVNFKEVEADELKGEKGKFGLTKIFGVLAALGIGAAIAGITAILTSTGGSLEKVKDGFVNFYENGILPFVENVIKPFLALALPALGDSVMSFIGSIGDLFAGLGDVGKLIGEGKFMDAFLKLGETLGKFFLDSVNNLFTLGAKLFGMEFAEGETIFSKIADGFRNIITDITNWLGGIGDSILNFVTDLSLFKFITDFVNGMIADFKTIFSSETTLSEKISAAFSAITSYIFAPLNAAINIFKDIFNLGDPEEPFSIQDFIGGVVNDAINFVKGIFGFGEGESVSIGDMMPEIPNPFAGLSDALRESDFSILGFDIGDKIASILDSVAGSSAPSPDQDANSDFGGFMAKGGPIKEDTPYVVGEAGPELIIPNSAGKVIPAPQTGAMLNQTSKEVASAASAPIVSAPVVAPQSTDNRTIISNKTVNQGNMETRNTSPIIRALNSTLAYA